MTTQPQLEPELPEMPELSAIWTSGEKDVIREMLRAYALAAIAADRNKRSVSPTAPIVPEWVSVDERLPKEFEDVLVLMDDKLGIGYWYMHATGVRGYSFNERSAVGDKYAFQYWTPLPQPPIAAAPQPKESD